MISVKEAKEILSRNCKRGEIRSSILSEALGRILAEAVQSPIDVPSFDNSAMDGYAMEFNDHRTDWKINGVVQAGDTAALTVHPGEAVRIFTGAKMPQGANTVIPQEIVELRDGIVEYQQKKIKQGANVRLKGSQCHTGEQILVAGTKITAGTIGLLASVGIQEVKIFAAPRVAVIITGNELKELGEDLKEGEIFNSNGPMLVACLSQSGIKEIKQYAAADKKEELQQSVDQALKESDVLILSGGISVGDYDFVKECLGNAGVKELFYKVKQRPGKPFFAGKKGRQWVFALPGNPASVLSCYYQYVKPCLEYWMGKVNVFEPDEVLALKETADKKKGFTLFMKAKKEGREVRILGGQQSFNLIAFADADCLVELLEEAEEVTAGTMVNTYYI